MKHLLKGDILKKFMSAVVALVMIASPVFADSCNCGDTSSSPSTTIGGNQNNSASSSANSSSTSGSTALNVTPSQSQGQTNNVSGISNPTSANNNIQVNNNMVTQYSFGGGVQCQGASVAVSGYDGASQVPGYTSSDAYGVNVSLVAPLGGDSYKTCNALSHEVLRQRNLDTCLTIYKAGFTIDANVDPELAHRCSVLRPAQIVQPVVQVREVPVVQTRIVERQVVVHEHDVCLNDDIAYEGHLIRREKYLVRHHLGPQSRAELTRIRHQLDKYCNQDYISQVLDANGSYLR